jgi:Tfp pilus assembly protein PilN
MQTINFYFEQYRPKPLSFDSRFAAVSLLVSLLGFTSLAIVESIKVDKLKSVSADVQQQVNQQQQQLVEMNQKLKRQVNLDQWQMTLKSRQREFNSYRKIDVMLGPVEGSSPSIEFSQILADLAAARVQSLWLTQINIAQNNLSLNGATTDANAIPNYVDAISKSQSLYRQFDELKIERQMDNQRIINFTLVDGRLIDES